MQTAAAPNPPAPQPAPQQQGQPSPQPPQPPAPPATAENLSLGVAALESFIEKFPAHKLASRAHLDIAASYVHFGRYEDAVTALKRFLADPRYKDREEVPEGRQLLGRAYQLQKKFPEALATWQDYLAKHPTHKAWSQVQREIVNTEFLMARDKMEAKQYEAAVKLFNEFLAKYPLDARNPEILYFFGAMNHQQEKWDAAIADWQRLVSKYPGTEWASRGQYMIAETLEVHLGKLEEALEAYRKVTSGGFAAPAQQAIARLTAKRMTVATERIFRSDEKPKLALATRNLESVAVRAYKVDLETYFRKMHLARGVEGLDIALISPDKTFEFKVPKYAKYQELESAVEVPLPPVPNPQSLTPFPCRRDGRHREQQDARGHHASDPERSGHHRQEFAERGVRLRREHAHRQAVAGGEAPDLQRQAGVCRRRRPARTACSAASSRNSRTRPTCGSSPPAAATWPRT